MSRRANDDEQHDIKPFDCVTSGQAYRDFKNAALRHLAGTGHSQPTEHLSDESARAGVGATYGVRSAAHDSTSQSVQPSQIES